LKPPLPDDSLPLMAPDDDENELEELAARLSASGRYRVLRRLEPRPREPAAAGIEIRLGVFLDVETTGLDSARDEIIELAMVPFTYGLGGEVFDFGEPFQSYNEPKRPIPPEITALTGIDDATVSGQRLDEAAIRRFVAPAVLILAHNAAFDRQFAERASDIFTTKAWACSMTQVDWSSEGYEGAKLSYLATQAGFFYDRHHAVHDCYAGLELLSRPLPRSGRSGLAQLLERARRPSFRIWAENSPFDLKDQLKARGYRWNGDGNPGPRAWYVDVDAEGREAELKFLKRKSISERWSCWCGLSRHTSDFQVACRAPGSICISAKKREGAFR
jgi:DNA polymerase III subunit epsilon